MSALLQDASKSPVPTFPRKPGSCVEFTVAAGAPSVFTPTVKRATLFEVRTTANCRVTAHPTGYVFTPATEPIMWGGEIDWVELGPTGTAYAQTLTMQGAGGSAIVSITELL